MNKASKVPSNKKAPSLVGTVSLTAGGHYAVVSHDGNIYAVRHSDYTRAGTDAICEVKDWLCSAMAVTGRSNKNGKETVAVSWYDTNLKKEVIREFELSKNWRQEMKNNGLIVTAHQYKRRILRAWLKTCQTKGEEK